MNNYRTRQQIKQDAKDTLRGKWGKGIMLYLIIMLIGLISGSISTYNNMPSFDYSNYYSNYAANIHYSFGADWLPLIIDLVMIIIVASADFKALDWIRNPELQFNPVQSNFDRFRNPDWWKLILLNLILFIFISLWSILLIIPGIIKSFSYSQTYFIYKDLSDKGQANGYSLTDFITRSRQLMDGHKAEYFVLQLSFIGWFLLGLITAGIAFIWIIPYYHLTMASYYRNLAENNPKLV